MRVISAALALVAAVTASALAQGPHTALSAYEEARGAPFGEAQSLVVEIATQSRGDGARAKSRMEIALGSDWALWRGDGEPAKIIDLRARRLVTLASPEGPDEATVTSLYAEARRRLDIYAGLSQGGSLEQITFGQGQTFHRIWLEAAMGVAAQQGVLEIDASGEAVIARHDGEPVATLWFTPGEDSPCEVAPPQQRAAMLAFLRHAAPLHPDLFAAMRQLGAAPCALEFTVISPESPQGRRERWVLAPSQADGAGPLLDGDTALPRADLIGQAGRSGAAAARGEAGDAPDEADFYEAVAAARAEGDLAGAFLLTVQETHHFGPCPRQTVGSARLVCTEINALTQAGLGDGDFERALEGVTAVRESRHPAAVSALSRFLDRQDRAGAAARILVANELVAWGREGLQSWPDLDPAALLAEALILDPHAPDTYWHLAQRYLDAGAPHAGWVFLDLGRALPGREPTALLDQAAALEARLAALAPDLAPAPRGESSQSVEN